MYTPGPETHLSMSGILGDVPSDNPPVGGTKSHPEKAVILREGVGACKDGHGTMEE